MPLREIAESVASHYETSNVVDDDALHLPHGAK